jgi:hypothetical protein
MAVPFSVRLLGNTTNKPVVKYLIEKDQGAGSKWAENPSCSPDSVEQPYVRLGAHPNVVTGFGTPLPLRCPLSVIGWSMGRLYSSIPHRRLFLLVLSARPMLRLPEDARSEAIGLGLGTVHRYSDDVVVDLADWGEGWIFGRGLSEEQRWCVRAFEHAGE